MASSIHFAKLSVRAMWRRPEVSPFAEATPTILPVLGSTTAPPVSRNAPAVSFAVQSRRKPLARPRRTSMLAGVYDAAEAEARWKWSARVPEESGEVAIEG